MSARYCVFHVTSMEFFYTPSFNEAKFFSKLGNTVVDCWNNQMLIV